jgi:MFS family permease
LFEIDASLSLLSGLLITFGYRENRAAHRSAEAVSTMLRKSIADIVRVRWVAALFVAYFSLLLGSRVLQPFVPIFIKEIYRHGPNFGDLPQSIGVAVTLSASSVALFAPIWGRLGDRFGYYRMLMAAAAGVALALFAQSFASDLPAYLVPAVAMGAFAAAFQGLFFAIIALGVPDDRRASVLNLAFLPFYLAGLLAPSLGTVLLFLGLRNLFRLSAVLMLVALGLLAASRRLSPRAIGK